MSNKKFGEQYPVESTNLKSVGIYNKRVSAGMVIAIRVEFGRGGIYDYYPCSEKQFHEAFEEGTNLKEWFSELKKDGNNPDGLRTFERIV